MLLQGSKVHLRGKRLEDAQKDYRWRADPELAHLDASLPIMVPYADYVQLYAQDLREPDSGFRFAIETEEGEHIGNCLCYGIDHQKKEAEIGIMIGERSYWNKGYGMDAVRQLADFAFEQLGLKRIYLRTLEENLRAQRCFHKCGFVPLKTVNDGGHRFILMEFLRRHWKKSKVEDG